MTLPEKQIYLNKVLSKHYKKLNYTFSNKTKNNVSAFKTTAINQAKTSVKDIRDAIVSFINDFFNNLETVSNSSSKTNLGILIAVIVLGVIYIAILIILFM